MNRDTVIGIIIIVLIFDIIFLIALPLASYEVRCWWRSKYDVKNFNCVDMSYALEEVFEKFGIDAKIVYGVHKNTSGGKDTAHCWLLVNGWEFDAVSLHFKKMSDVYSNYFVEEGHYLDGQRIYGHVRVNVRLL